MVIELLDGADQPEVPFLDQIEERHTHARYCFANFTTSFRL